LITDAFVNFLAVHDAKYLKLRVQKFVAWSVHHYWIFTAGTYIPGPSNLATSAIVIP